MVAMNTKRSLRMLFLHLTDRLDKPLEPLSKSRVCHHRVIKRVQLLRYGGVVRSPLRPVARLESNFQKCGSTKCRVRKKSRLDKSLVLEIRTRCGLQQRHQSPSR